MTTDVDDVLARLASVTVADFEPRVGEDFRVSLDDADLSLRLLTAEGRGDGPEGHRAPFELQFSGPTEPALPQGTFELTNEHLGTLHIFLVPAGPQDNTLRYQAVFN